MPKLIYSYLASLDGFVADRDGGFAWAVPDEEVHAHANAVAAGTTTHLYGRRMYEVMAAWETEPALAAGSPVTAEFARTWQAAEKVVFSTTLTAVPTRRTRVEARFEPALVRDLKASAPADLSVSGAGLAAAALRAGLVDECHVYVAPVLVGGGTPMFPEGVHAALELLEERRFTGGMVYLRHAVRR